MAQSRLLAAAVSYTHLSGDTIATIETTQGAFEVVLYPQRAPKAVENFTTHVTEGYYNGLKIFQVVRNNRCLLYTSAGNPIHGKEFSALWVYLSRTKGPAGKDVYKRQFLHGADIHTATASQVFNLPPLYVTPLMRSRAKAVNFGIVYGIGAFSLSQDIGVSVAEADKYIKDYLRTYSGVKQYMEDTIAFEMCIRDSLHIGENRD